MSTFVLIHGAWHGGWTWHKVAAKLEALGHTVIAPDLPGHGADQTPVQQITLDRYARHVVEVMDKCSEPVVLAGHSMGGIVISQAAEQRPQRVQQLVYVCAFLLRNGQMLLEFAGPDAEALVVPNLIFSEDKSSATIRPEILREVFYADCSDQDYEFAVSRLVPQATAPLGTQLRLSQTNFGRIPRVYVECRRDRAISLLFQRRMQAQIGCARVFSLNCSHSPFFSAVDELVDCLLSASELKSKETRLPQSAGQ